jgi:DNA-binding GntR family transcriptional regulator
LRLYYQSYEDRLPQRFVDEHEDIIAVIAARDSEAADRLATIHAEQIVQQIQKLFARGGKLDIAL